VFHQEVDARFAIAAGNQVRADNLMPRRFQHLADRAVAARRLPNRASERLAIEQRTHRRRRRRIEIILLPIGRRNIRAGIGDGCGHVTPASA